MIERVLEPEVMESQAESIAYDDMDHGEVNERFVQDLLSTGRVEGEVLDVGTGTARIPMILCERHETVRVLGIDLSTSMLDIASMNIHSLSLLERIMLDRVDAKQMHFETGRFDVVMSNSIVHHLPNPEQGIAEAVRVCKPGGLLFFRDLLRPDSDTEVEHLCETYVRDETDHGRRMFEESLRAALTVHEMKSIVDRLGLSPSDVAATSDRHWTWSAVKPV